MPKCATRLAVCLCVFLCPWISSGAELITWTRTPVMLETDFSSWARMVKLPDGSWLSAYALTATNTRIRLRRSFDNMRSWTFVTEVAEEGRDLDNPNLVIRADGVVLLAFRSIKHGGGSYYLQVYESADLGASFSYLSQVDWDHDVSGVYEPFLYIQPDGSILCFYASETHKDETPAYAQTLSEKVSFDGGRTWGPEIIVVAQPGGARAGEGNVVRISGTVLGLFYEMCGSENCIGHVIYSADGVTWSGIGPALPNTFQNVQAVALDNGLILATSNLTRVIVSPDSGNTWIRIPQWPFLYGSWPALYQTGPDEVAMVVAGGGDNGEHGLYIRFGTINLEALSTATPVGVCRPPAPGMPQNCR